MITRGSRKLEQSVTTGIYLEKKRLLSGENQKQNLMREKSSKKRYPDTGLQKHKAL